MCLDRGAPTNLSHSGIFFQQFIASKGPKSRERHSMELSESDLFVVTDIFVVEWGFSLSYLGMIKVFIFQEERNSGA